MNCKKCGTPLIYGDMFCKNCGAAVNEALAQNNQIGEMNNNQNTNLTQNSGVNSDNYSINQNSTNVPNVDQNNNNTVNPAFQEFGQNNIQTNQQPTMNMYQQSQPMQQPLNQKNWQSNNTQNFNQPSQIKSGGNIKSIVIGVIVVAVIVFGAIGITNLINKNINGGSGTETFSSSTYDVNFKGFKFKIPNNYVYEKDTDILLVSDEAGTWAAKFELGSGSYSQIKSNINLLQAQFQKLGFSSSAAVEKKLAGINFITLEISTGGTNAIAAITKANSMNFMGITLVNQNNEYDYSLLKTIAPIIKGATYIGETNNIQSNIDIDYNSILDLEK